MLFAILFHDRVFAATQAFQEHGRLSQTKTVVSSHGQEEDTMACSGNLRHWFHNTSTLPYVHHHLAIQDQETPWVFRESLR